jgi:ubiquinone/menaquinone biosynthesis C-methylase UbiE
MSVKVVFFVFFLIVSMIGLYYNYKNMNHAEKYLHETEDNVKIAHANCLDKAQRVIDLGAGNGQTAEQYCKIDPSVAYLFPNQ